MLDLRLEENPSSSSPETIWSLYDDSLFSSDVLITAQENALTIKSDQLSLGGTVNGEIYGIENTYLYESDNNQYRIDLTSELLNLLALSSIAALSVKGKKNGEDYEFIKDVDWITPYSYLNSKEFQELSYIEFVGDTPDVGTEFKVIYQFNLDFENKSYANLKLGSSNNINVGWVNIFLPDGFLKSSEETHSPMFVRYNEPYDGNSNSYKLKYGIENLGSSEWNEEYLVIYNEQELLTKYGSFTKSIDNGYPLITFNSIIGEQFNIVYGVRSQYELGYGFQKVNKPYSDSVRLIYNDMDNLNSIINEFDKPINSTNLGDPSLLVGLDNSDTETILELYNIPLLYAPELNLTFILDSVIIDQIKSFSDFNTLEFKYFYVGKNDFNSFYSDSFRVSLDFSEISLNLEDDGSYLIRYNKDLQGVYDASREENFDIYISISQVGISENYIPYIILEKFDYICDDHLLEMYDRMPRKKYGDLDVKAVINTPHYIQAFSMPFRDSPTYPQFPDSPFDLLEGSEVTVALEDLPYSSLVSLNVLDKDQYNFNYLGTQETLTVSDNSYNMIENLAIFTEGYNIDETIIQEGFLNLYYGSSTSTWGEEQTDKKIYMDYENNRVVDYFSHVSNEVPDSWEYNYQFTDKFLTTEQITVSGTVLYHQLFDLNSENDVIDQSAINAIFEGQVTEHIEFGVKLPDDLSIAYIESVGNPYYYDLSIQGFPIGGYIETTPYCNVINNGYSNSFTPSSEILDGGVHYSLEFASNGSKYLIFYSNISFVSDFGIDNKIMVDYVAYHKFTEGFDYKIVESTLDPFITYIEWDYSFTSLTDYKMHPDFSHDSSFNVKFSALQFDFLKDYFIKDISDKFTYKPRIKSNISVEYTGQVQETFSVLNIVPDSQFSLPDLINAIYVIIWDNKSLDSIRLWRVNNFRQDFFVQDISVEYLYTINFDLINNYIPLGYEIIPNSYVFVEVEFISTQMKYPLSATPFNYDYIDNGLTDYHITLKIDGDEYKSNELPSPQLDFHDYVDKIENNWIYFNNREPGAQGYISPQTEIILSFKHKEQPGILEKKHFLMVIYPWSNVFDTVFSDVAYDVSSDSQITYREEYRKLSGSSIISPFEYSLSVDDTYSLYLSYRLNQRDYFEKKLTINYAEDDYVFNYLPHGIDSYVSVLVENGEPALNVYFYDIYGRITFLEENYYNISIQDHTITLLKDIHGNRDYNPITAHNNIQEFWVSFIPNSGDIEFDSYRFSYDPNRDLEKSINVNNWDVSSLENLDVIPNLDAYYFMNDKESSYTNVIVHA